VIVTISRAYGALGRAVTRDVAARLGYRLVDDDLPKVVAARLGTSPEAIDGVEHRTVGFGERFLRSLGGAVPEAFQPTVDAEDLDGAALREIERLIRDAADAGDVVIVGRGGNVVLAGRPDLVRVFLTAPAAWRAVHVAESLGVPEAAALAEIARVDAARRAFARERYDIAWGQPAHYDLVIDVSTFGASGAAALIAAAVTVRA
jgi:cytidylate kinase